MNLSVGILAGLAAMFSWGIGDFLAAIASRKIGNYKTLFWMLITGFLVASIYFLIVPPIVKIPVNTLLLIALVGFLQMVAVLSFYRGFEVGLVSVVSPISSSYAWIVVLLSIIFLKEQLTNFQLLGILLIIFGIPIISIKSEELKKIKGDIFQKGMRESLLAMSGWGVSYFILIPVVREVGWFLPVYLFHFFSIIFLSIYGLITKQHFKLPNFSVLPFLISIGILSIVGFFFSGFGFQYSLASIVTPIAATFPLVTIILARIFLKEKLVWNQVLGIGGVIAGLVFLSL